MSANYELYPCPFCGGEGKLTFVENADICVQCKNCEARGAPREEAYDAVENWNNIPDVSKRDRYSKIYREMYESASKNEREAYTHASKALVRAKRINKQNEELINVRNRMSYKIQYAIDYLTKLLSQKPKHMLARSADGELMGADRARIISILEVLDPAEERKAEEED